MIRKNPFRPCFRPCRLAVWTVLAAQAAAQPLQPPPIPAVRPAISRSYPNDNNGDKLEDALANRAQQLRLLQTQKQTGAEHAAAQAALESPVEVELVFDEPITQKQIDAFLTQGGQISHIYQAVSYGWNGRIPLAKVHALPPLLGASLVLVEEAKPMVLHMDTATRTGRVRPIWNAGFAGNVAGYDGDPSITIGIADTGVDGTHADLTGRGVFWHDYSTDALANPSDIGQHGSHVAGIALGSGASAGNAIGTLGFTQDGSLSGVASGSFYPNPIELPAAAVTVTMTATWNGTGSTSLYWVSHAKGVNGGWVVNASATGTSPLTLNVPLVGDITKAYSPALISNGTMTDFVVKCQVANYPGSGDGFSKMRGVAPACNWAGAKVFTNAGSGTSAAISAGVDGLVANRVANNIKVMNLSLGINGSPGLNTTLRQKINTAVNNGIVVVASAGNDGGAQQVDDPGRSAMALTIAAANDINQLTGYTSAGFASPSSTPGREEDFKPDLMAPGGSSSYHSSILSVDSNSGDGTAFADQQADDYYNIQGTSMAAPFAAGSAALVIDALQQSGLVWDFNSSLHSRYVKMLLCATASESNNTREDNTNNPTLQRAAAGPSGFPAGKDLYEGYGMINPDAAIEAATVAYHPATTVGDTFGSNPADRRVWARKVTLMANQSLIPTLTNPAGGDYDLHLYSNTPSAYGTPALLASSTTAGNGGTETFTYTAPTNTTVLLVVKRVSGSGSFSLTAPAVVTATINQAVGQADPTSTSPVNFTVVFSAPVTGFTSSDVTLSGTVSGALSATVTGSGTTYNVAVSGMNGTGTLIASIPANAATDSAGNGNAASTSTDNTVTRIKGDSVVTSWPTASEITFGQTLASCTLSGGSATPPGSFSFTNPSTVPPLGTSSQSVTFTPTDTANYLTSTGTINVTATAPEIAVEQPLGTGLADGTSTVNFGSENPGSSGSPVTFTVKNTGTASLSGLALTKDGSHATDFTLGTLGATTLAPGASTSFTVTFNPSASGTRTAAAHLASTDSDENPFDINLTGYGRTPIEVWRFAEFGTDVNTGQAANTANSDNDRLANLMEYALGLNPKSADPFPFLASEDGISVSVTYPKNLAASDVTISFEKSTDMGIADPWSPATVVETPVGTPSNGIQTTKATHTPPPGHPRMFLRMKVAPNP